jgi:hypothetical protein
MAFEDAVLLQLRSRAYPTHFTASVAAPGLEARMHYTLLDVLQPPIFGTKS